MNKKCIQCFLMIATLGFSGGCSDEGNPVNTFVSGVYVGTYTIQQGLYTQQGTVTLNLSDENYDQRGRIEVPAVGTNSSFQENGTFKVQSDTIIFNFGKEILLRVTPAWSLSGPFKYENNVGVLMLEQNLGASFIYTMVLQRQQ